MDWSRYDDWGVGKWHVSVTLAGGSLLPSVPWRVLSDLFGSVQGLFDVLAVGFIITQSTIGNPAIGLVLAWVLIGYLVFANVQFLYPSRYESVVDHNGFRLISAIGTVYFGLVWGLGVTDTQLLPFQIEAVSSLERPLLITSLFIGGVVVFGVSYWGYFHRLHPMRFLNPNSDLTQMLALIFPTDSGDEGEIRRTTNYSQAAIAGATVPALICALAGMVAAIINVFYPIPEFVFFVGILATRFDIDSLARDSSKFEIDIRLFDSISAAIRDTKGFFMIVTAGMGLFVSAGAYLYFAGLIGVLLTSDIQTQSILNFVVALLVVVVTVGTFFGMGIYYLLHWVRQIERIEPFIRRQDTQYDGEGQSDNLPTVTRPPGLLLPAHAPIVAFFLSARVITEVESTVLSSFIYLVSMIVAICILTWGLIWTRRHSPQRLDNESRDLLVTVLFQFTLLLVFLAWINWEPLTLNLGVVVQSVIILAAMSSIYYIPEGTSWKQRQDGLRKLFGDTPVFVAIILAILLLRVNGDSVILAEVLMILMCLLLIMSTYINDIRD